MHDLSITPQPRKTHRLDISANLIQSHYADLKSIREQRTRVFSLQVLFGTLIFLGYFGTYLFWSNASAEHRALAMELGRAEQRLQALGGSVAEAGVSDAVLSLPNEFRRDNKEAILWLGHALSASPNGMRLRQLQLSEDKSKGRVLTGQAEASDIRAVRVYLDRLQAELPGSAGLMTSVAVPQGEVSGLLNIDFEVVKTRGIALSPEGENNEIR